MKEVPIDFQKDEDREVTQHIFAQAQGKVIRLSAVPTATVPLLQEDEWGSYSNVLYHRVDDTILVFTPGSTTTITNDEV